MALPPPCRPHHILTVSLLQRLSKVRHTWPYSWHTTVIVKCRHINSLRPVTSLLAVPQPAPQVSLPSCKSEKWIGHDCGWVRKEEDVSSAVHTWELIQDGPSQSELHLWYMLKDQTGKYLEAEIRHLSVGAVVLCTIWVLTVQEPGEQKAQYSEPFSRGCQSCPTNLNT